MQYRWTSDTSLSHIIQVQSKGVELYGHSYHINNFSVFAHLVPKTTGHDDVICSSCGQQALKYKTVEVMAHILTHYNVNCLENIEHVCIFYHFLTLKWHRMLQYIKNKKWLSDISTTGLLPDVKNCGLRVRRKCRERFPRQRGLAIPTRITARASRSCRDTCRVR